MYQIIKTLIFINLVYTNFAFECVSYNDFTLNGQKNDILTLFNNGDFKGKGSFGEVHTISINNEKIAIKKIHIEKCQSLKEFSDSLKEVLTEISILSELSEASNGKYFPKFYGCARTPKSKTGLFGPITLYVVQESLEGDLKKGTINLINIIAPKDRLKLYLELAEGLEFMHSMKYVHSDLKPENVMYTEGYNNFKIIDFGMTGKTSNFILGGSPLFNAPEKINEEDDYNRFSHDIWAYGLTIASIEAKAAYLFSGIDKQCFKNNFSSSCGIQLLTKVGEIMNTVFGNNSSFGNMIKKTVIFSKRNRIQSMTEIVKIIKDTLNNEEEVGSEHMTSTKNHRNKFKYGKNDDDKKKIEIEISAMKNVVKRDIYEKAVSDLETMKYDIFKLETENLKLKNLNDEYRRNPLNKAILLIVGKENYNELVLKIKNDPLDRNDDNKIHLNKRNLDIMKPYAMKNENLNNYHHKPTLYNRDDQKPTLNYRDYYKPTLNNKDDQPNLGHLLDKRDEIRPNIKYDLVKGHEKYTNPPKVRRYIDYKDRI